MAKFSACIFPLAFIDPEQSARMKKWSGRWEIPPPGMTVTLAVIVRFLSAGRPSRAGESPGGENPRT